MLRSFDYAIETASEQKPDTPDRPWAPPDLRQSFLAGYFQSAGEHGLMSFPASPSAIGQWLTFFELEKAFYELDMISTTGRRGDRFHFEASCGLWMLERREGQRSQMSARRRLRWQFASTLSNPPGQTLHVNG